MLTSGAVAQDDAKPCAFGYCKGDLVDDVTLSVNADGLSYIRTEHRFFDTLAVYFTRSQGVCRIAGLRAVDVDRYGDAHKMVLNWFVDLISSKYGKPSIELDFLQHGSVWNEPQDWLMSLRQKNRHLEPTGLRTKVQNYRKE